MNILGSAWIFTLALNVCSALYLQTAEVNAYIGESIILPCNVSGLEIDGIHLQWESMGKDVISLREGNITVGTGYENRVYFFSDPTTSGVFSLVLTYLSLNDGDIYELLWEGTRPLCSVLVHVLIPPVRAHIAFEGEEVTLACFGNIPKNKPWEDIFIQWFKDGMEVLRFSSGRIDIFTGDTQMSLPPNENMRRGNFSLTISSVRVLDTGDYQCHYKSMDYQAPRIGVPETYKLTVLAVSSVMKTTTKSLSHASESSYTHTSRSVPTWMAVASTQTAAGSTLPTYTYVESTQTAEGSTVPTYTYVESTQTAAGSTVPTYTYVESTQTPTSSNVPTQTYAEITGVPVITEMPPVPEASTTSGQRDPFEFLSDEKIPWIRIGLISGVLLVTAVILGSLLVFGKI